MSSRIALAATALAACLPVRVISLEPDQILLSKTGSAEPALDVIGQVSGGADPLPVAGAFISFSNVAVALGRIVSAATQEWAVRNRERRPGGWQLLVELTRSRAEAHDQRLTVELEARITLRGLVGHVHLGQTTAHCVDTAPLAAGRPAQAVYECMERMARDLAGWVEAVNP